MRSDVSTAALPGHVLRQPDLREALAAHDFGRVFFLVRKWAGISYSQIADATGIKPERIGRLARGEGAVTSYGKICEIADSLQIPGRLIGLPARPWEGRVSPQPGEDPDAELEALDLARRVEASDVGAHTLAQLAATTDHIARSYATVRPEQLLPRARGHLAYVVRLIESRKTLQQHRRLLITGGWLSLLVATMQIDLRQRQAALGFLVMAEQMAASAEQEEIAAWCEETRAWDLLTEGHCRQALASARRAQARAPAGSSALIQATAQEGRAWARLGESAQAREALTQVMSLAADLPQPEHPEHHYAYDPAKLLSYTATTLAWVGDPAAQEFARTAVDELTRATAHDPRPRRLASARLDFALALLAADRPEAANAQALAAVTSGRIVASNWWRATDVLRRIEATGLPEATQLLDAYHTHQPAPESNTNRKHGELRPKQPEIVRP